MHPDRGMHHRLDFHISLEQEDTSTEKTGSVAKSNKEHKRRGKRTRTNYSARQAVVTAIFLEQVLVFFWPIK